MLFISYLVPCLILIAAALYSIFSRNTIRAALSLGIGSVALAVVFFLLKVPFAAGFELSVGAGLTSILMIIAISLTRSSRGKTQ